MKKLTLTFTPDELRVLTTLAADQLFRKEFIDPKLPGYRQNHGELELGKSVVGRLRSVVQEHKPNKETTPKIHRRRAVAR